MMYSNVMCFDAFIIQVSSRTSVQDDTIQNKDQHTSVHDTAHIEYDYVYSELRVCYNTHYHLYKAMMESFATTSSYMCYYTLLSFYCYAIDMNISPFAHTTSI